MTYTRIKTAVKVMFPKNNLKNSINRQQKTAMELCKSSH